MAQVYILYSEKTDNFYCGSCVDFEKRLLQHINHEFKNSFTKRATDWKEFLLVDQLTYEEARQIESHIKRMKSKIYIQNLKKYPEMLEKLIAKYRAGSSR